MNLSFLNTRVAGLAIAAALLGQGLTAATFYVATDGSDSNPGSASAPFRTLQQAANTAFAGDTVVVRDGTYGHENSVTGGDSSDNENSPVVLYNSGTLARPSQSKRRISGERYWIASYSATHTSIFTTPPISSFRTS